MAWSGRNYKGAMKHRKALKHEEAQARIVAADLAFDQMIAIINAIDASTGSTQEQWDASLERVKHEEIVGL